MAHDDEAAGALHQGEGVVTTAGINECVALPVPGLHPVCDVSGPLPDARSGARQCSDVASCAHAWAVAKMLVQGAATALVGQSSIDLMSQDWLLR